ncbi:MAG: NUDIX hydrolase [Patescibacteria group bacterium]
MKRGKDYVGVAVVTLCHDGKGNYLLGQRSDKCRDEHFRWDLIGSGGVDVGETLNEAVEREVKEESGAGVTAIEFLGYREVFRDMEEGKTHYIVFDYKVEIIRERVINTEPEKCLEIGWFTIDHLPEPMHSQWPAFFEQHKDKL